MPRRLCLWTDSREPSGVGVHMLALASGLQGTYEVTFACPPGPRGTPLLEQAAECGAATLAVEQADHLPAWLRRQPIDIFHAHAGIGWEAHDGIHAARAAGVPIVVRTEHLPYLLTDPQQQRAYRELVPLLDGLVCVSRGVCASHLDAGVPPHLIHVVQNGIVPPERLPDRQTERVRLGWPADRAVVLTVGRFTEQKGHRLLLDAIERVHTCHPQARFVWVGDGPLAEELAAQIAARALGDVVEQAGRRDDVPALMAAADLFVLPSQFEGLPLVVLEAMSAGMPVVGTRVCGTSEAVGDGVTGWLVEDGDPHALAAAINSALDQPAEARMRGAAGRRAVTEYWNAARMVSDMCRVYSELLGSREQAVGA